MDKQKKKVQLLEMSCPWMVNRKQKEEEKISKCAPLRWEIRQQYPHYKIAQYNIIIDVLGGVARKTLDSIKDPVGVRADKILLDMQKAVISSTTLHGVSKFSLRRNYELAKLLPIIFWVSNVI